MREAKYMIILSYLEELGFKADYRTADAAVGIILFLGAFCKGQLDNNRFFDNRWWVVSSYDEWSSMFPSLSMNTIKRLFKWLSGMNLVNKHVFINKNHRQTNGYSLNYDNFKFISWDS